MKLVALVVSCAALGACEKAVPKEPLAPEEMGLLRDIPGGNIVLVGGNFSKLEHFADTAMAKLGTASSQMENVEAWGTCLGAEANNRMIVGVAIAPRQEVRMAFRGHTIETIETCATKAHFTSTVDPDRKYVAVTLSKVNGVAFQLGYLQLANGDLLSDIVVGSAQKPTYEPLTRAQLEAIAARLSTSNASADTHLVDLATKANRTKTFWFAGTGATTSLAKELGDAFGDIDVTEDVVSFDVTAVFTDLLLAQRFEQSYKRAKADMPGSEVLSSFTKNLTLTRDDGTIHAAARLTLEQLQTLAAMAFH
jgi:hypothetical protein